MKSLAEIIGYVKWRFRSSGFKVSSKNYNSIFSRILLVDVFLVFPVNKMILTVYNRLNWQTQMILIMRVVHL